MRTSRTAVAATAVAAGLLSLSACAGSTAPAPGPSSASPARASATAGPVKIGRCHTGDLGYSWATGADAAPDPGSPRQQRAQVLLKDVSAHPCSMHGFPGADLVSSGRTWPLLRESHSPGTVTLRPGETTGFTVTFLPWPPDGHVEADDFAPTTLVITPPKETTSYDLPWRWGHVLLQDGTAHPGTYFGPVGDLSTAQWARTRAGLAGTGPAVRVE